MRLKFPAAVWGLDSLPAGAQAGIGLTMNDGDTEAGQGGQKAWSGWARTPPSTARTPRSAVWSRSRRGRACVRETGFLLNQQRVCTEASIQTTCRCFFRTLQHAHSSLGETTAP